MEGSANSSLRLPEQYLRVLQKNSNALSIVESNILSVRKDVKTIYVTSCFDSEGKTTAAIHLAYALGMDASQRVLLMDGNSRSPKIHDLFGTKIAPGLTNLVSLSASSEVSLLDTETEQVFQLVPKLSELSSDEVIHSTVYRKLSIMPYGTPPKASLGMIAGSIRSQLELMKDKFDYVIMDGASFLGSSHAPIISSQFDGVVLVIESERTKWEVVQMVIDKVNNMGGFVLGAILNKRKFYIPRFLYGKF